jgi:hypothetical protein
LLEALVAATATTGLFALARSSRDRVVLIDPRLVVDLSDENGGELPCPWCRASTAESDTRCPSCHQAFG